MTIKIIFIGDIVGRIGREAIKKYLPQLIAKYQPDLVLANAENLAHGIGFTQDTLADVQEAGVDLFTSGNHAWAKGGSEEILDQIDPIVIRPANYPQKKAGVGFKEIKLKKFAQNKLLVVNLLGKVFIEEKERLTCPFKKFDEIWKKYKGHIIIVDFHGEATSEKYAFAYYVDGRVSAVLGTHTHAPTSDLRILAGGTAYLSDVGMVGYYDSVIGANKDQILKKFLNEESGSRKHDLPITGLCQFNAIYLEIDLKTQKTIKIKRLDKVIKI